MQKSLPEINVVFDPARSFIILILDTIEVTYVNFMNYDMMEACSVKNDQ